MIGINFVEEPKYEMIVSDGYKTNDIIKNISLIDPSKRFIAGKTLIFFDEIQQFPDIATSLKFFKQDGRFDVICSGSMLGINYRKIESNSVGYKKDYTMYSLDFEEFLRAKGYDETLRDDLLRHMLEMRPFSETEMTVFRALFLDYCVLGGMLDDEAQDDLRANKNLGVYKGALYENIVGEAIVKSGGELCY